MLIGLWGNSFEQHALKYRLGLRMENTIERISIRWICFPGISEKAILCQAPRIYSEGHNSRIRL